VPGGQALSNTKVRETKSKTLRERSILSTRPIYRKGRIILPVGLSPIDRLSASLHLNEVLGVGPMDVPVVQASNRNPNTLYIRESRYKFVQPGSSRLKAIMNSKELAFSYTRLCLMVAFTPSEFRKFRKFVYLFPAGRPTQQIEGLTWYKFNVRKGIIPLAFGFWCLRHWTRTLCIDPRSPKDIVKLPTLEFLTNYSSSSRLSRGTHIGSRGFAAVEQPIHRIPVLPRFPRGDLHHSSYDERLSAVLNEFFGEN